jgi:hypothetical protein
MTSDVEGASGIGVALRVAGGFALGAVMAVFLPPLAVAMALVLGGVLAWSRLREEPQPFTPLASGFVVAVGLYVALGVAINIG